MNKMTKKGNVCAAHREMDAETASAMPSTRAASGDHRQATVMKTGGTRRSQWRCDQRQDQAAIAVELIPKPAMTSYVGTMLRQATSENISQKKIILPGNLK
jgi:hypothetical protein